MTLVLLDTNAYLRLAKRIKPLLGIEFGQKPYELTILKDVEDEVRKSKRLQFLYPWFDDALFVEERFAKRIRLSASEKATLKAATSVLRAHVLENAGAYTDRGRSPPSETDCCCLAFGQIRAAIVATDDLGMHLLAQDFDIHVWHGHELLKKVLSAKLIDSVLVREIYEALEGNGDLPNTWHAVKHTVFKKFFGPAQ